MRRIIVGVFCVLLTVSTIAQESPEGTAEPSNGIEPTVVSIETDDGAILYGDYFVPHDGGTPVVLLLHQLYTRRSSWNPIINPLLESGFRVLAVDLRGYGASSGAGINWTHAQDDTQAWLRWLYGQPGVRHDAVFIAGASMGANLALVGCTQADLCNGAVALSPGRSYFGVQVDDAIISGKPALIVYADRDYRPRRDMPELLELAAENGTQEIINVLTYPGRAHGVDLFRMEDDLLPQVIGWMAARIP